MTKAKWVVIEDEDGRGRKYNLASMTVIWQGQEEISTGIYRTAIYLMPRARKVIQEINSLWESPPRGYEGTYYNIANEWQVARLAEKTSDERLMNLAPVTKDGDLAKTQ